MCPQTSQNGASPIISERCALITLTAAVDSNMTAAESDAWPLLPLPFRARPRAGRAVACWSAPFAGCRYGGWFWGIRARSRIVFRRNFFQFRWHLSQIGAPKVFESQHPEDVVDDRRRHLDVGVTGDHSLRLEPGKGERLDELFQRHPVLQAL